MLCIGNFMTYSHAIENDCGLYYRFIPFYAIYYTITNIGEVWHWAVVRFAGVLFMIAYFVVHHAPGIKQGFEMGIQQEAERQAHRAEYQLTIEAYDIDEDSEEEGTFEESYSPTAEQLSTKIKSLPWMNPKKSCSVMLVKPEEAENVEESLHLSTIMAGPNAPATFQITWSVVKADSFVSMESEPFSTVDEALLVFEAFQKADPTWKDSVKWNPHAAP